jgi:hypothetical protein
VVRVVGADFVVVGAPAGRGAEAVVALAALESVRTLPGAPAVVGDRPVEVGVHLVDVLAGLAEEREAVQVVAASGDVVGGLVAAVGRDVVTVRSTTRPASVTYVPLAAVAEIVVGDRE